MSDLDLVKKLALATRKLVALNHMLEDEEAKKASLRTEIVALEHDIEDLKSELASGEAK